MTHRPAARAALLLGLSLLVLGMPAAEARAQVRDDLNEAELEYEAALRAHESALAARAVVEARFSRFAQEADIARRAGDENALEEAFARAQAESVELRRLDRRVEQTEARLEAARETYLDRLGSRIDALLDEARGAGEQDRAGYLVLIDDLSNRIREVEGGLPPGTDLPNPVMPEIAMDPRDGPEELAVKADLLERAASRYDSLLVEVDEKVEDLRRRARRAQALADFREGIDRFGDTRLPDRPPESRQLPPDQLLALGDSLPDLADLTPEQRIEVLLLFREKLEDDRDQLRERAQEFRERAGGVA